MRPFRPTTDDIARRIVARVMALPDDEVARLLGQVLGEFADRHEQVEAIFRNRFEQVKIVSRTRRAAIARAADAHRRLLHARVFAGVGGVVQSVHRAASRTSPDCPGARCVSS